MNRGRRTPKHVDGRRFLACALVIALVTPYGRAELPQRDMPDREFATRSAERGTHLVGFTAPVRQAALAPLIAGRILDWPQQEGATVPAGTPLILLDDSIQRARWEMAKADADSKLEVELAQVRREQAQAELSRIEVLARDGRASTKELLDAQARMAATRIEWHLAAHQQVQQERDAALQQQLLAQHVVQAPFEGYVSRIEKRAGEAVEDLEPVIVLTQLDPLEIVLDCPIELVAHFREGSTINVTPADDQWQPRRGSVTWVSRVANAASQTVRIKLHVDNRDFSWLTGMKVRVDLPMDHSPSAAADSNGASAAKPPGQT